LKIKHFVDFHCVGVVLLLLWRCSESGADTGEDSESSFTASDADGSLSSSDLDEGGKRLHKKGRSRSHKSKSTPKAKKSSEVQVVVY